jgi:tetratricopeptide (TPR) repeat protein
MFAGRPVGVLRLHTMKVSGDNWRAAWLAAVLALITIAVYLPSLRGGFLWDDDDHLTENPAVNSPEGIRDIWTSLAVSRYYPLTLSSFWLQNRLWGLDPLPYRLVTLLLHAANAILLWRLLLRLRLPGAWAAAALWAVHPLNVESVAWITELKNTQSGLFFFLGMLCFLRFEQQPRPRWYAAALGCAAAALLSKPSTVVLPVMLLGFAWWQRGRWTQADWARVTPFFALSLGMSLLTVVEQRGHIAREGTQEWTLSMAERAIVAGKAVWFYAGKVLWPVNLSFIYPRWELAPHAVASWVPVTAAVAVAAGLWRARDQAWARAALFGCGCYVVALGPVLGFFDVYFFQYSFVADHFAYLASAALIALVVAAGARSVKWREARIGAVVVAVTVLAAMSWRHGQVFHDNETLWLDTIKKNPAAFLAHNNLAVMRLVEERYEEALHHSVAALRAHPDYALAHYNLGVALEKLGRFAEAESHYRRGLELQPDNPHAHNNLGNVLAHLGRHEHAIAHYRRALELDPGLAQIRRNLGMLLVSRGRAMEAQAQFAEAIRLDPDDAHSHYHLGVLSAERGEIATAMDHYREALRSAPDFPEALNYLAWLLATADDARLRDPARALELALRACDLTGHQHAVPLRTLAVVYAELGQLDRAIQHAESALALAIAAGHDDLVADLQTRLQQFRAP